MLELREIRKQYGEGDSVVHALGGVSLKFRENEFVSILGASGCGKTTLLNIVGGLDRYTSGDLIINGKSTKDFCDADWDTYRNHSIGFVFQSYNLIPHQTVLSNVELALTLSGVSKAERRQRAVEALAKVGLGDQIHKKPNQMSGGQMQRVAIARALVNNPDILLADEPTGALDTATSVQIMDLLKEVAREKLVIMVTHNPDLAAEYSTRIVRLSDGVVVDDTNPYEGEDITPASQEKAAPVSKKAAKKEAKKRAKKKSMSFTTAVSLSFNNLLTKKARTILTSFAGSIGIIGIALILSLSNGIQAYIDQVQEDTLSTYPLTIQKETADYQAMLNAMTEVSEKQEGEIDQNTIYVDDSLDTMMSAFTSTVSNDLVKFNNYLMEHYDEIKDSVSDIQYTYDFDLQVFNINEHGVTQVSPTKIFDQMGFGDMGGMMQSMGGMGVMSEMINNQELLDQQYELVGENSHWPTNANEVVLVVGKNNQINKMTLYMLGVLDQDEIPELMQQLMKGNYVPENIENFELDDFLGMKFKMLNTQDFYEQTDKTYTVNGQTYPVWKDIRENPAFEENELQSFVSGRGEELTICGIIRPREGVTATSIGGAIGYKKGLTDKILEMNKSSAVIDQQKNQTPTHNVLTGLEFTKTVYTRDNIHELISAIDKATMEQYVYPYMTELKNTNPNVAQMMIVDEKNFGGMFFLLDEEHQREYLDKMLTAAYASNAMGCETLFASIEYMFVQQGLGTVDITKENFVNQFMGLMSTEQKYVCIAGYNNEENPAMSIVGLGTLAGETAMKPIYSEMSEIAGEIEVTAEMFEMFLPMLPDNYFAVIAEYLYSMAPQMDLEKDDILLLLGDAEKASPASINFYAKDFESKDNIEVFIKTYNEKCEAEKRDADVIQYTDLVGALMSSVSLIINVISYVLIAFVSISLIVSSIMIGIITYISVLERTKEIGVLRSIGASKRDISRVFNAETLIVGLAAGLIGIIFTVLLCLPINAIIHALSGMNNINAVLPWLGGVILVLISMLLTFVAGLIPSRLAAKKDPVEALRTE